MNFQSDEQKLHTRHGILGKIAKQIEAQNYSRIYCANVAGTWRERLRDYPGRAHGHVKMYFDTGLK